MSPDDVAGLVEGAPWWVKLIVMAVVVLAPVLAQRLVPDRRPAASTETTPDEEDDEDVRELRDTLISVLQKLQRAETEVATLTRNLADKDLELRQERAQTAALEADLGQLRADVQRLQGLLEMVVEQRRGSTPPPTGL